MVKQTGRRHNTNPPSVGDTFESSSRVWPLASSISILVSEIATRLSFRSRYPVAPPTLEVPLRLWKRAKSNDHLTYGLPQNLRSSGLRLKTTHLCVSPSLSHGPKFPSAPTLEVPLQLWKGAKSNGHPRILRIGFPTPSAIRFTAQNGSPVVLLLAKPWPNISQRATRSSFRPRYPVAPPTLEVPHFPYLSVGQNERSSIRPRDPDGLPASVVTTPTQLWSPLLVKKKHAQTLIALALPHFLIPNPLNKPPK